MKKTIAFACVLLLVPTVLFSWDGSPRIVAGVTSTPQLVASAPDAGYGAFVAWQEPSVVTPSAGTLRVLRLTPDGDADGAWPAGGVVLGGGEAVRSAARLLPDGSGGVYAWWLQVGALRVTRVLGSGAIAPGWTAAGRSLGVLTGPEYRPWVEADGSGGVWLGWFQGTRTLSTTPSVRVIHLGADGLGAGGWPNTPRSIPLADTDDEWVYSASFARAQDGGAWVLVATGHVADPDVVAGDWRLARFTAAGLPDPSLPPQGAVIAPFDATQVGYAVPRIGISALASDGAGGVFAALGAPEVATGGGWSCSAAFKRLLADGSPHPQQPSLTNFGFWFDAAGPVCSMCSLADFSLSLPRDASGELYAGICNTYTHVGNVFHLEHLDAAGGSLGGAADRAGSGISLHPDFGAGFVLSSYDPTGPTHAIYDPAYASVGYFETVHSLSYSEESFSPYQAVYTASDVAPLPNGGALLVWARANDLPGFYAVRLGANGSALAVGPPAVPARGLRLAREGAALRATWGPGAEGTLRLHDVAGRERAHLEVTASGGAAVLARSGELSPGVYFARLVRKDGTVERARAVVLP